MLKITIATTGLAFLLLSGMALASTTFGAGITLDVSTELVLLQDDPHSYFDTPLRIEGRIVAVVPDGSTVRIEDTEGNGAWVAADTWAFGDDLLGLYAVAEGQLENVSIPVEFVQGVDPGSGSGPAVALRAVGAVVGEIEAIVADGIVAVIPPGSGVDLPDGADPDPVDPNVQ